MSLMLSRWFSCCWRGTSASAHYALLSIHIMALLVLLLCALLCLLAIPVCRALLLYVYLLVALACTARPLCLLAAHLPVVHPLMPICRIHLRCLAMAPLVCLLCLPAVAQCLWSRTLYAYWCHGTAGCASSCFSDLLASAAAWTCTCATQR